MARCGRPTVYFTSPVLMGMEAGTECLLPQPNLVQTRQGLRKARAALMMVSVEALTWGEEETTVRVACVRLA